jgi:hypothetical protein
MQQSHPDIPSLTYRCKPSPWDGSLQATICLGDRRNTQLLQAAATEALPTSRIGHRFGG